MRYNFEIRKEKINQNGMIPIRLVVSHEKFRIRKSIAAKTLQENWNYTNCTIDNPNIESNSNYQLFRRYNNCISETKNKVEKIFSYFEYNDIPFSVKLFNEKFENNNVKIVIGFYDAFEEYLTVSKLTKTASTITKYKSVKKFLEAFEAHTKYKLQFDNINFRFEEAFMEYCFIVRKTLNNYYAKIVKSLKAFMSWCFERGYHDKLDFKRIKSKEDEIEVIYLTSDELMLLYNHKFTNKSKERARDLFCFLCFSGQRHSDIYALRNANIDEDYLSFTIKKTKTVNHRVFLVKYAKELLAKYKDTIYFPIPRITSQKLNEKIQECCEDIGLTQEMELVRFIGAERISQTFRKCDLISSHCGRKTFITNSLFLNIPERVVRAITNHKDEKSFRRYVNISETHKQRELEVWNSI